MSHHEDRLRILRLSETTAYPACGAGKRGIRGPVCGREEFCGIDTHARALRSSECASAGTEKLTYGRQGSQSAAGLSDLQRNRVDDLCRELFLGILI